ncbi:protein serrate isoform X4 [Tachypleus tridentatus]|uniref:protein serrate isoform X4 n=1 Tax=Tachypleus tridentatus TaxID=6853 RepID=UPI003FD16927
MLGYHYLCAKMFAIFLITLSILHVLEASGSFELQILGIQNSRGELLNRSCCGGEARKEETCPRECNTYFRLCLKQYQSQITAKGSCTFGSTSSSVAVGNSFSVHNEPEKEVVLKLPFEFRWTKSFTLILEAVDHNNRSKSFRDEVIERHMYSGIITPSAEWHQLSHPGTTATINYRIRVTCDPYYYNYTCTKFCRPRHDRFGHYTCSKQGDKICLVGWKGPNCETAVCKEGCHPQHGNCEKPGECKCRPGWESELCDKCAPYPGCKHGYCENEPWQCKCYVNWGGFLCNKDLNYCGTHEPCQNGGTCENTAPDEYRCRCPEGFSGVNCEVVDDPCATSPCANGGICSEINGTYSCTCKPGWKGETCQQNINECETHPCHNGGTCVDLMNGYYCLCKPGWAGNTCQQVLSLEPSDADECIKDPCINAVLCKNVVGDYICECQPGWMGKNCDHNINDCVGQCQNGATCIDLVSDYHCACLPGFTGRNCQTNIDDCASNPCLNGGECVDLVAAFSCICPVGYKGARCEIDDDFCNPNPCENGASCFNMHRDYYCHCSAEYHGKNCSQPRPKCTSPPCEAYDGCMVPISTNTSTGKQRLSGSNVCGDHGKCISEPLGGFTCVCDPGYTGRYCHENINDCVSNPCKHGGTCVDKINSFLCVCKEGWEGPFCNTNKNDCEPNPCHNNGTCIDSVADFICECRHGWKGKTCNFRHSHCAVNPCANGGTCTDLGDNFVCQCPRGFEGHTCQIANNPSCLSSPCQNGGTCISVSMGSGFSCVCKEGYEGILCQNNIDDCNPNPCYNNGRCVDGINWFRCECAKGFAGPDCRINIDDCASSPCAEGSTCRDGIADFQCICPPGQTGRLCNIEVGKRQCEWNGFIYNHGTTWDEDCNTCLCHDTEVTCTKFWCGFPNCLADPNSTGEKIHCPHGQECAPNFHSTCFIPPCPSIGICVSKENATKSSMAGLIPNTKCKPNSAELGNNCATVTLVFNRSKILQGLTVEGLCMQIRRLPKQLNHTPVYTVFILCDQVQGVPDSIEVTVSSNGDPSFETYKYVSNIAKWLADRIGHKRSNSTSLGAVIEVKVKTSLLASTHGPGYLVPVLVSLLALLLLACFIGVGLWYYRHHNRRKGSLVHHRQPLRHSISSKLEQFEEEEKSNNQNEENLRRYHNPLHTSNDLKEKLSLPNLSDSTEMTQVDNINDSSHIPQKIYKAQSVESQKNITPTNLTEKALEKDNNLKSHQRRPSGKEVIV